MSEKPQGFPLPDDFIKALEKVAVEKPETSSKKPTKSQKFKKNILRNAGLEELEEEKESEKTEELNEVVENDAAWVKPDKNERENVSSRMGGSNFIKKSNKAIDSVNGKDILSGERKTKQPNPEDLQGVEFNLDGTEKIDALYDLEPDLEKYLKADDIENTTTLDELFEVIDASEGIYGKTKNSRGNLEFFDKEKLKMIIKMVQNKESVEGQEIGIEYITRNGGLRQKVFDLLQNESKDENVSKVIKKESVIVEDLPAKVVPVSPERIKPISPPESLKESVYSPEDFEKDNLTEYKPSDTEEVLNVVQEDPDVLIIPKNKKEFTVEDLPDLENLPEVPALKDLNEKKKPIFVEDNSFENSDVAREYNKEIKSLEKDLLINRSNFILAHKEVSEQEKKFRKNPFKKFLMKAFGVGSKKNQEILEKNENIRKAYEEKFLKLVSQKTLKETDRILSLHANSRERREYESITPEELKDFINEYPDLKDSLEEYEKYEGVTLSTLLSTMKNFSKEQKEKYRSKFIYRKIMKDLSPLMIKNEDAVVEKILSE